ncbi:hypothetical protein [Thermogutta sp.]|uniref:hypothetical protein n=1 Tax=Thermogutta sp. TaxID=1962930 RepID=UPI0032204C98
MKIILNRTRFVFAVLTLGVIIFLSLTHHLDTGGTATALVALISAFFAVKAVEYYRNGNGGEK